MLKDRAQILHPIVEEKSVTVHALSIRRHIVIVKSFVGEEESEKFLFEKINVA